MLQHWINSIIWDCKCKRAMNHDRKKQERKFSIIARAIILFIILVAIISIITKQ